MHIEECKEFGLTAEDLERCEENQGMPPISDAATTSTDRTPACTAYTRYVLDIGQSEDWLALQISMLPCLLGYGVIARRLHGLQATHPPKEANRYLTWINNYIGDDYSAAIEEGSGKLIRVLLKRRREADASLAAIEKHVMRQSSSRVEELVTIFIHATKVSLQPGRFCECALLKNVLRRWKPVSGT